MKNTLVQMLSLSTLMALSLPLAAGADAPLFERYPQTKLVRVSDGQLIGVPLHDRNCVSAMLAGTAPVEVTAPILEKQGLYPLMFSPSKSIVYFSFMQCEDTSIGPVQEFFVILGANTDRQAHGPLELLADLTAFLKIQRPGIGKVLGHHLPHAGGFVYRLSVSSLSSIVSGSEIWGMPNVLGQFKFRVSGEKIKLKVLDEKGTPATEIRFDAPGITTDTPSESVADLTFFVPRSGGHSEVASFSESSGFTGFKVDSVEFKNHTDTDLGQAIEALQFTPWLWDYSTTFQSVFGI